EGHGAGEVADGQEGAMRRLLSLAAAVLVLAALVRAQHTTDPFPKPIPATDGAITVRVREFASLPDIDGLPAGMKGIGDGPGSSPLLVYDIRGPSDSVWRDGNSLLP